MNHIVFVLNDIEIIKKQIAYTLNKRGFKIDYFTSVKDFHGKIDPKVPPDILIVDHELKEGSCEKMLQELKNFIPVIICVAGAEAFEHTEEVTKLYKLGATDVKPKNNPGLLFRTLNTILKRAVKDETRVIRKEELNYGNNV